MMTKMRKKENHQSFEGKRPVHLKFFRSIQESEDQDFLKREEGLAESMFSESLKLQQLKNSGNKATKQNNKILVSDKSSKILTDNPYSDTKTRTGYSWKNQAEVFRGIKGSQNLFNDSIKRKNYFYPHVGIGGGAGNIFNTTSKNKMTLEVIRKRNIPTGNGAGSNENSQFRGNKRFGNFTFKL